MIRKLTPRELRVVQLGVVILIAIPVFTLGPGWLGDWGKVRQSVAKAESQLKDLEMDDAKQAGLFAIVPVCEVPQAEETQKFLFRDKLYEQLKKAGINTEPLQFLAPRKVGSLPYKVLKIQCNGKCKFDQLLEFLAGLRENPYLIGIEELSIECDSKQPPDKRQEVEIKVIVSTFVK
jgi:hypothetical protein